MLVGDIMNPKDKEKKEKKETKSSRKMLKNIMYFLAFVIVFLVVVIVLQENLQKEVYAKDTDVEPQEEVIISQADKMNTDYIESIIESNSNQSTKEEFVVEEAELEYLTKYKTNTDLPKGMVQVVQEGRTGIQEITIKKTYQNGELVSEEVVGTKVTKSSINKIVEIGGGNYTSSYKVKVGDLIYATPDRLQVMLEPSEESQKVATLSKNTELKVTEVQDNWYKIISGSTRGYVKTESTTYINPNSNYESETTTGNTKSKSQLISQLSFDMALNKPSGLSLEQFKKVLSDSKDTNNIFANNAEYFYYIEKQYNINGIFVAAIGIHESGWGTSKISLNKGNLFGYGAYDSSPYNSAYNFTDYSESIDLIARVLVKYYLNPKGTSIYDGQVAAGTYYNGPTLSGVNTRYATDKNWANAVYNHMKYLYNKL